MIDKLFDRTYSAEYIIETLKGMSITDEDGCASLIDHNIALGMAINAIERYSKYEDTGITPEQIRDIDKLYLEKCQEVNKLKAESLTGLEMAQIYATLNHYKKLEEQGRLIELPCKVGDTVYKVNKASRKVAEHNVIKIEYESNDNKGFCCQIWFENYDFCFVHHFGKTVFLTREEAEKVLDQQQQE